MQSFILKLKIVLKKLNIYTSVEKKQKEMISQASIANIRTLTPHNMRNITSALLRSVTNGNYLYF